MAIITLSNSIEYEDIYQLLPSISSNKSVIISNYSSYPLFVIRGGTQPSPTDTPTTTIQSGEDIYFEADGEPVWVKGSTGPINVNTVENSTGGVRVIASLDGDLYTEDLEGYRRLRVDLAQTSFFLGHQFRAYYEFDIAASTSEWIRFTCNTDFVLFNQNLVVDKGGVRFAIYSGATASGTWTPLPIIGKNRMSSIPQPPYTTQATAETGGSATGGVEVDLIRAVSPGATAQHTTVGASIGDERGLPAGVYFLRLENIGLSGNSTGMYSAYWEERP